MNDRYRLSLVLGLLVLALAAFCEFKPPVPADRYLGLWLCGFGLIALAFRWRRWAIAFLVGAFADLVVMALLRWF